MHAQTLRPVGRTDLQIPILGLGTCPLGGVYVAIDEAQARATYSAAWEGGIRFYDTAPWYGLGQAEHRTGRALYDLPRDSFTLTTKVGRVLRAPRDRATFVPPAWKGPLSFEAHHVFTYDAVMRSYEDSLQRLGINRVDALYIHDLDSGYFRTPEALDAKLRELDQGGGYRALAELKSAGEISAIGAGINERGMIRRFLEATDLDLFLVASRYTLLEHGIYADEIALAGQRGASVVVGGAFNSGILATGITGDAKYEYGAAPPEVIARVQHLTRVAQSHGVALAAAALQFPLAAPEVCAVVFGAVTPEEVRANIAHFAADIPAAFWSDLRSEGLIDPAVPLP
ncbi:aldo/keto reductase [Xinfangfangia sp. D13-10-4-6]|uniref:aldo/keto reductase n=1 Tax=Pseudogemmobacter hezensis TaxID=2737662 RepID=UPI0015530322|nr:aldo/keto reductase [Pseudogemmobacter hezensis]NPD16843.1 aldo/keto reductase [Pseudogemmobacter hezensis]